VISRVLISLLVLFACILTSCQADSDAPDYDVAIIGGGASGVAAGVQAARMGAKTIVIESTQWLGGMLTSAGVSAIDGNNRLPSGFWGEFRDSLVAHYGNREALETGWVSNTLFEPNVAQDIFTSITNGEDKLTVLRETKLLSIEQKSGNWNLQLSNSEISAKIVIDATELGDVAAAIGIPYDIGMQDGDDEPLGPKISNNIIQDLTWVATLKDFGEGSDKSIEQPANYDPLEFDCACNTGNPEIEAVDCRTMLNYGKLPNDYYMINWPNCGNDTYINPIELNEDQREELYEEAKEMTRRFVYYIQNDLGFKHFGLAEDIYPTEDHLAMTPYHRESRRIKGEVRLLSRHLASPYDYNLYRTGIAVGDYPIDHHHKKNLEAPRIDFIGIKVPSYSIPLASLLPKNVDNLIIAEKSISVSNIVNGATRLQPVVLGIGQAAGTIAGTAIRNAKSVKEVGVREVQKNLLESDGYLLPFIDVEPSDEDFKAIQKAGALGILKGTGIPYKWANQTWVYPDSLMTFADLKVAALSLDVMMNPSSHDYVTPSDLFTFVSAFNKAIDSTTATKEFTKYAEDGSKLSRRAVAQIIDKHTDLFSLPVKYDGKFVKR
jgi:hypothetical protein